MHTPTPIPAADLPAATVLNLEGRMRLAMNRLIAAADPDKNGNTYLCYVTTEKMAHFFASVDSTLLYSANHPDMDTAVDKAIAKYNAAKIRKSAEADRLAEDSETEDTLIPAPTFTAA